MGYGAEQGIKGHKQGLYLLIAQAVIDLLSVAARFHYLLIAQYSQLLRQGWLPDTREVFEGADILFALGKLAQEHQPVFVGQEPQQP